jgi:hypothetical protein
MYVGDAYQQKTMFVVLAKKQGNHILFWKIKAFNNIIWPHFFCLSKVRLSTLRECIVAERYGCKTTRDVQWSYGIFLGCCNTVFYCIYNKILNVSPSNLELCIYHDIV